MVQVSGLLKDKKGILFTITTILLLLAVFLLSAAYLTRNNELQRTATLSLAGNNLRYFEDDIGNSIYPDLLLMNFEPITRGSYVAVIFSHSNLTSAINHSMIIQDYETFIEGTYSALNNIDAELTGLNNSLTLYPYNTTFTVDGGMIYAYTYDPGAINSIILHIEAVEAGLNISDGRPADNGDIQVSVNITHAGGRFISSAILDPAAYNSNFYVDFNSSRISVNFGRINNRDGTLVINASGLKADIPHFEIRYNPAPDKAVIKGGKISLISAIDNITKYTDIIVAKE